MFTVQAPVFIIIILQKYDAQHPDGKKAQYLITRVHTSLNL